MKHMPQIVSHSPMIYSVFVLVLVVALGVVLAVVRLVGWVGEVEGSARLPVRISRASIIF